jgi:hypothetical protein
MVRIGGTYCLTAPSGITLNGNEAEYVLERCGGDTLTSNHYYPLVNYVSSVWNEAKATTFSGAIYYPGSTASSTFLISMLDDERAVISTPTVAPSDGLGLYSIWFQNQGCSELGGCAP